MKTELLQSAFHDILAYGSLRMKKSKLLWMLGRSHESPSAWDLLLREWAAFGQTRPLFGLHWGDEITLSMSASEDIGARWSKACAATAKRQMPLPLLTHLGPEGGPASGKKGGPVTEAKAAVSLFRHASA